MIAEICRPHRGSLGNRGNKAVCQCLKFTIGCRLGGRVCSKGDQQERDNESRLLGQVYAWRGVQNSEFLAHMRSVNISMEVSHWHL